jgi:hypothetical protein
MSWQNIARADVDAGLRSWSLWAVVVVFFLILVVFGRFVARGSLLSSLLDTNARTFALLLTFLFVPVVGLLVGHRALGRARERARRRELTGDDTSDGDADEMETSTAETSETDAPDADKPETDTAEGNSEAQADDEAATDGGTETGVGAQADDEATTDGGTETGVGPATSHELFVGTVVGRAVVLMVAILAGFLPVFVAWVAQSGTAALYEVLVAFLVAVVLGLLFVAVAIAISTLTASAGRAAVGAASVFVGLYAWPFLPSIVGIDVPFAVLEQFWLVFLVGDLSTTLFSLRQGEVTAAILGTFLLGVLVAAPLAFSYHRLRRAGLPD